MNDFLTFGKGCSVEKPAGITKSSLTSSSWDDSSCQDVTDLSVSSSLSSTSCLVFPPARCIAQFEHVAARRGLIRPVSPSYGQIQSQVQAPASQQRRRLGADAPVPGTAAVFRRGRGSGGGAGGLSVHRQQHWTCEPHTCSRSDQGQGKKVL